MSTRTAVKILERVDLGDYEGRGSRTSNVHESILVILVICTTSIVT